ncbi:MAG: SDR family oxidoreductase [Verrucomicrobiota bacterium]
MERRYNCALITGASAGLGEEFVKQLLGKVDQFILVARRLDRLEHTADEIRKLLPETKVMVIAVDVSNPAERVLLGKKVEDAGLTPDLLINNAGLGDYGEFVTAEWQVLDQMLRVNIDALTHLTHLFAPRMAKQKRGWILNVSSLASTLAIPDFGVYAATKAYVSSFSEALRIELKDSGVEVMSLCPGPVRTEFGEVARREGSSTGMPPARRFFYVSKQRVVAEALSGLGKGRARVFPGTQIAIAGWIIGSLPLFVMRLIMGSRPRR